MQLRVEQFLDGNSKAMPELWIIVDWPPDDQTVPVHFPITVFRPQEETRIREI